MTARARSRPARTGVVIAGGGLAGQRACEALRRIGYDSPIRMIAAERHQPYDRPPLSKDYLAGTLDEAALPLRPRDWYADHDVDLLLGQRAVRLDPLARTVITSHGDRLRYAQLLIATGSSPRRLPLAAGYANVHELRTLDEARALRDALTPGRRLAIIGAGFIGQEVAATASARGTRVTLIEEAEAPLARLLGADLGRWFARFHRDEGIDVLLSARVRRFRGSGAVDAVELSDGRLIECDAIVVGIGTEPATDWLADSPLEPDGVRVDGAGRTVLPDVFAAGDASSPFNRQLGQHVRSEHWDAAARHGAAAAHAMLGVKTPPAAPPGFWSDQHGTRIQYVGHPHGADAIDIDGDPDARDFTATYSRRGQPIAALLVGRPHALPGLRRRIHDETPPRKGTQHDPHPEIDEFACAAHGDCALAAPGIFAVEDIAVAVGTGPDDAVLEAARACPAGAIAVVDEETGEQIYP